MRGVAGWPEEVEFPESKRREVFAKRGIDLLRAARIFEGDVVTVIDERGDYGEVREVSIGMVGDDCYIVVHTRRGDTIRLITAWKGGKRDRIGYQKAIALGNPSDAARG